MLYGRSAETAAIGDLIDRAGKGHGGALVLRGEAGAGKTALLDLAASRGGPMRVLRTTGVEAEADLAFAALHQLLLPVAGLLDALPEPQAEAVRGALGLAPAGSGDRFLLAAGVLSLLAEAAAPNGLICVVDDLQWVDRPSADALLFAARRLRTEPIAMPLAVRGDAPVKGLPSLEIAGLAEPAAAELLDAGFALAPPVRRDLVALTGGNPLALHETARLLTAPQRAGREPLPDPLPGGSRLFGDRVAALSPGARLTALLAAVESDLGLVLRAAERLGAGDATLPEIESAGLAGVSGTHVRFRHPLIRSAVYEAASPAARREAHAALAEVSGGDRRAWHLAGAALGQDEPVAAALALAAERARDRGGYGAAATALTRAAELTPEPLVRAGRLKDAAVAAWLGGRPGQAESLLAEARELAGVDTALTMEIARLRGRFELSSGNAAEAVRILAAGDTLDMLADASEAASYVGEVDLSSELAERAGRVARVSGMTGQLPVVLEFVATAERLAGRLAESRAVSEEGLDLAREAGYANTVAAHLANLAAVAALRGEEEACARYAGEALAIAVPHRVGLRAGLAAYALAMLDLCLGRFAAAHDRFTAIVAAGPGAGHPTVVWRSTPDRIEAAAGAGDGDASLAALEAYERWSAHAGTAESRALLARCRGLVLPDDQAVEALGEASRLHANPFEAARTGLLLGERLRRTHRPGEARAHLRAAFETFQRAGAAPWARRAYGELRAAGESVHAGKDAPPAPEVVPDVRGMALDALTPQELRIATLVADGATSKEIAARLFLSPRTVEYHLYKIYPKLGITSRTELARLVVLRKAPAAQHSML
ncbi:ATP-binding protein [Microbispora bryophytorum]|uniref:ATP-binding protein n=1 Tax=Microbispora bryophytorum TaxID=1460882 RepID=UPI0033E66CB8